MTVLLDMLATFVDKSTTADPVHAVATELESYGIDVRVDWTDAYTEPYCMIPTDCERSFAWHIGVAVESVARNFTDGLSRTTQGVRDAVHVRDHAVVLPRYIDARVSRLHSVQRRFHGLDQVFEP